MRRVRCKGTVIAPRVTRCYALADDGLTPEDVGGQATPCAMSPAPIGDMARDGVVRVWNSEAYGAFRARLASDDPPSPCKGCALYQ